MSHPYGGDDTQYEAGYEKGYEDCQSELTMKIQAVLRFCLYSKGTTAFEMSTEIGKLLEQEASMFHGK